MICERRAAADAARGMSQNLRSRLLAGAALGLVAALAAPAAQAEDYTVTGPNSTSNGDGNPSPITGLGDNFFLVPGAAIDIAADSEIGVYFMDAGGNRIEIGGNIGMTGQYAAGIGLVRADDSTVQIDGAIALLGHLSSAVAVMESHGVVVTSNGGLGTAGDSAHGVWFRDGGGNAFTNHGDILTVGDAAFGVHVEFETGSSVTNAAGGEIRTQGQQADGIMVRAGQDISVANHGDILTENDHSNGIEIAYSINAGVNNAGLISTLGETANGISAIIGDSAVTNTGTIETVGDQSLGIGLNGGFGNRVDQAGMVTTAGEYAHGIALTSEQGTDVANAGTIEATGDEAVGISLNGTTGVSVTNSGTISTQGYSGEGILDVFGTGTAVTNTGLIETDAESAKGIMFYMTGDGRIENLEGGTLRTAGDFGHGIHVMENSVDAVIRNAGLIETNGEGAHGVFIQNGSSGFDALNTGTITTSGASSAGLVVLGADDGAMTNTGTISTTGSGGSAMAMEDSDGVILTNEGTIETAGLVASGLHAINSTNGRLVNRGVIDVTTAGISPAIRIEGGDAIEVVNSGTLTSGIALLTDIDTHLTLEAGSRIQGSMIFGAADANTVTLDHNGNDIGWSFRFEDFDPTQNDTLVVNGAPYVTVDHGEDTTVLVADTFREESAATALADISGAISSTISQRTGIIAHDDRDGEPMTRYWSQGFGEARAHAGAGLEGDSLHMLGGLMVGADRSEGDGFWGAFGGTAASVLRRPDPTADETGPGAVRSDHYFGGLYGHLETGAGLFLEKTVMLGYADGAGQTRYRANNTVLGGLEALSGGDVSGIYAALNLTAGAEIEAGEQTLIPSASLSYASQWRHGYTENDGLGLTVGDYQAKVLTGRLELASQREGGANGSDWVGTLKGGLDLAYDMTGTLDIAIMGIDTSAEIGGELMLDGYLGGTLVLNPDGNVKVTLDAETGFGGLDMARPGGRMSLGIAGGF